MKVSVSRVSHRFNNLLIGFLGMFTLVIIREFIDAPVFLFAAAVLIVVAVYLAKKTVEHFHGHHHKMADSAIDAIAPAVLLLANIVHPAVDGFSLFQTFSNSGFAAALVVGIGIVLHEILRQAALVSAFRPLGIPWYTVLITALCGITGGIWLGVAESSVVEQYEYVADLATIFAYSFIIAEFYFHTHDTGTAKRAWWVIAGILIALVLEHVMSVH